MNDYLPTEPFFPGLSRFPSLKTPKNRDVLISRFSVEKSLFKIKKVKINKYKTGSLESDTSVPFSGFEMMAGMSECLHVHDDTFI